MELNRVIDRRTIGVLLVITIIVCVLFYNQQIQNGTQEILSLNSDYIQEQYTIFDVNTMYQDMMNQYINEKGEPTYYSQDEVDDFMGRYYQNYIEKATVSFSIYKVARVLFENKIEYTLTYNKEINQMCENALETVEIGAFSDPSSYAYNNILKTRYDLIDNAKIRITLVNGRALESIFQYKITGFFLLVMMIYLSHRFVEERKKGLWQIIHAASYGRRRLAFKRVGVLAVAALLFSLVIHCSLYIESFYLFGGMDSLQAMVQSSSIFAYMTWPVTGMEYLIINIIVQAVAAFGIGIFIWALTSLFDSQTVSGGIILLIFSVEYLAYQYIPATSVFGVLKYTNVVQLVNPMDAIVDYVNCGPGEYLVSRQQLAYVIFILEMCVGLTIILMVSQKKYPISKGLHGGKWLDKAGIRYNQMISRLPSICMEIYKLLIYQKGIYIIMATIFLVSGVKIYGGVYYNAERDILRTYYNEIGGSVVNDSVYTKESEYEAMLSEKNDEYQKLNDELQSGQSIHYSYMMNLGEEIAALEKVVPIMQEQITYLNELKAKRGIEAEVISPFAYENILGGGLDYSLNLINLYLFLTMVFLMNANFSYERKRNMIPVIKSCMNGRWPFIRRKLEINVCITVFLWAGFYGKFIYQIWNLYDLNDCDCSILSLSLMQHVPINVSIRFYLLFSIIIKLIIMLAAMMVITLISLVIEEKFTLIVSLCLMIPHVLYILGFQKMQYFSVILPMNNWQMQRIYNGNIIMYAIYIGILIAGILSFVLVYRKWTKSI